MAARGDRLDVAFVTPNELLIVDEVQLLIGRQTVRAGRGIPVFNALQQTGKAYLKEFIEVRSCDA